jgi:hypothetical protein
MDIKEEGMETDYIPEFTRARLVRIEVDMERSQAYIQCVKGFGESVTLKSSVRD